ncbi:MAG: hypothetical protein LBT00_02225 [Spirochaetaceae bacterium]|nr:hypothetical protein [Spirochaetaceae bacterium]
MRSNRVILLYNTKRQSAGVLRGTWRASSLRGRSPKQSRRDSPWIASSLRSSQ